MTRLTGKICLYYKQNEEGHGHKRRTQAFWKVTKYRKEGISVGVWHISVTLALSRGQRVVSLYIVRPPQNQSKTPVINKENH